MASNLKGLIGKLNDTARTGLEAAAGFCLSRTHYDIEIEHFLMKLLEVTDSDLQHILKHFAVNKSHFASDLTSSLDKLKTGNARTPVFSPSLVQVLSEAWTTGSLDFGAAQVRSGFCILAIAASPDLARLMREVTREFQKISEETLRKNFWNIVAGSPEDHETAQAAEVPGMAPAGAPGAPGGGKTQNLNQFTIDLTANARAGKVDPVLGRDHEIRQIIDILTRRRQNNPILTGEAGVGKTAVVEGFALRVAAGDVPPPLKNVTIRSLDLALLQAGAGIKGEFENRLKGLIEEVKSSPTPIILFIDEAHTMIGAGGSAGQGDAANLLKPALARGELRTIAATTWSEYKKYFEKDPALARRFQLIKVEEPSEQTCMVMMRSVVPALEKHHKVRILDEGAEAAVRLSHRYLADRQLPDKAVSVLDTACARLALGQNAIPAALEDAQRQLDDIAVQTRVLEREKATGADHAERLAALGERKTETKRPVAELKQRWEREGDLVTQVRAARERLEASAEKGAGGDGDALRKELAKLAGELESLQGETPLVPVVVDANLIGQVISGWTGIPAGKMLRDEVNVTLNLERHLEARIIGQAHSLEAISRRIRTSRAGIEDPGKPVGVFLLVGPSGVGKTETALALSDLLYGGERNLITINMSEFQEPHTVSTLKGSPPGYVGYGEGGVLTEAVRRRPYSVVLLDEVEKAHPDVLELFFQVFDKGQMEDGEGREINFKNNIIILTTNACTDQMMKLVADPETAPGPKALIEAIRGPLVKVFPDALLNRLVVVPFYPISKEMLRTIIKLNLSRVEKRVQQNHKVPFTFEASVPELIANRCTELERGARMVDALITNTLLPEIGREFLTRLLNGGAIQRVHVSVAENNFAFAFD